MFFIQSHFCISACKAPLHPLCFWQTHKDFCTFSPTALEAKRGSHWWFSQCSYILQTKNSALFNQAIMYGGTLQWVVQPLQKPLMSCQKRFEKIMKVCCWLMQVCGGQREPERFLCHSDPKKCGTAKDVWHSRLCFLQLRCPGLSLCQCFVLILCLVLCFFLMFGFASAPPTHTWSQVFLVSPH